MTTYYDDKILTYTSQWITTNGLVRCVRGNKTRIVKAIHDLESEGYLESRKVGNTIQYSRKDNVETNYNFNKLIDVFQMNQNVEFDEIEKIKDLKTKSGKLSKRSRDLLEHIEEQVDSAYKITIRTKYQEKLGLIPYRIAQKRIEILESIISKIMNTINTKYSEDVKLIQEYFQNHSKEYRFKI